MDKAADIGRINSSGSVKKSIGRDKDHPDFIVEYRTLARLSLYIVAVAWLILGLYILWIVSRTGPSSAILDYFLSTEEFGIRFRALILLAPFILTVVSYLISEKSKLLLKSLMAEDELRTLFNDLIVAFANALDAKSSWTMGHTERVTILALAIAEEMNIPAKERETLRIASLMHDIGKIGTYDIILDKTGPLTPEEWELIKKHPVKAEEILGPIRQLHHIIPIIKGHHERVDGKGYPDGLKGDEIPVLAKVLCLADSFDAMIAERPYKKGLPPEMALSEVRKKTGTQFATEVATAFFRVIDKTPSFPVTATAAFKVNPEEKFGLLFSERRTM